MTKLSTAFESGGLLCAGNMCYPPVPNKRAGEIIGGRLEMAQCNNNRGVRIIRGAAVLGEIKNGRFLGKHVSFIFLCEQ